MNIQVTARHFNSSPELQERLIKQIEKLERYHDRIIDANVILDAEKRGVRKVEILMNIQDKSLSASAEEENMGKAIESAVSKMERILKKENDKSKRHKSEPVSNLVD